MLFCRVFVALSFEESVSQVSRPHKLFSPGRYPNLWGPVLPRHQETPAGLLHLWYKTNRMQNADMVDWWLKKQKKVTLIFSAVPRYLLEDVGRGSTDPFMISDYTHGENKGQRILKVQLHVADVWAQTPSSRLQVDGTLAPPTGIKTCSLPTVWRSLTKYWVCAMKPVKHRLGLHVRFSTMFPSSMLLLPSFISLFFFLLQWSSLAYTLLKKNAIDLQKKRMISALVHRLPQWNPVLWLLTRTLCCNFHMFGRKKIQVGHDVVTGRDWHLTGMSYERYQWGIMKAMMPHKEQTEQCFSTQFVWLFSFCGSQFHGLETNIVIVWCDLWGLNNYYRSSSHHNFL